MALYDDNAYYGQSPISSAGNFGTIRLGNTTASLPETRKVMQQDTRTGDWAKLRKESKRFDNTVVDTVKNYFTGDNFSDAVTKARMENENKGFSPNNLSSQGVLSGMDQFLPTNQPTEETPLMTNYYPGSGVPGALPVEETPRDGGVADASKGEVVTPNPATNPAQHIAASTANKDATKVGTDSRKPNEPAPDTPAVAAQKAAVEQGKRVAFDMNKVPKWNESKAFNMSLISFGLNLLSGNSYADAFNAAGATFGELYGKEKREAWAEDLRAAGYDEQEIQQYIETGDNKVLTDPMEKHNKAMENRFQQLRLQKAEYDMSPERIAQLEGERLEDRASQQAYQKFQQDMAVWGRDLQERQLQQQQQYQNDMLKLRQDAAQAKLDNEGNLTARDFTQLSSQVKDTIKVNKQRAFYSNLAQKDLENLKRYKAEGNVNAVQSAYKSFAHNMARAEKGGGAKLTEGDIDQSTGLTSFIDNNANKLSLKATGMPTDTWINSMDFSVRDDIANARTGMRETATDTYLTLVDTLGHEKAQDAVRRSFHSSGAGTITFDPITRTLVGDSNKERVGANSVLLRQK